MRNSLPYILLFCLLFCACSSYNGFMKHAVDVNYYQTCNPPGGVKITDNSYCDISEVTNINYLEYMFWTGRVYGTNSKEYMAILPDTMVWRDSAVLNKTLCIKYPLTLYYLRGVIFENNPVVGITQKQAIAFSKWRSDRVMEFVLVTNKEIIWDSAPKRETFFTIEKYYSGQYKNIKPKARFSYYPDFRIPTVDEWKRAVKYNDSIIATKPKKTPELWLDIAPCRADTLFCQVTESPAGALTPKKGSPIYNLKDNVSEWTSDSGICVGGGWFDKKEIVLKQDTFHRTKPNAWTGFRNVCQWKKWDIKN